MSEESSISDVQAIYQKMGYLQAEISAMRKFIAVLVSRESGEELSVVVARIENEVRSEYDRYISEIEDENPHLAALLDFRWAFEKGEQDKWYFPKKLGEQEGE